MASRTIAYDDGFQTGSAYGAERFTVPVQDGPKRVSYPFKNTPVPDSNCIVTTRDFVVRKSYDVELINASTRNGGFETAGGGGADVFASWSESVGTGTLTRDTSSPHSGSACAKWISTGFYQSASLSQTVTTPGKTYKLSLWSKSDTGASFYGFIVNDGANTVLSNTQVSTSWTKYEVTFTANYSYFEIQLVALSSNGIYVDDITLTEIDSVEAFDSSAIMGVSKSFTNKFLYSSDLTNAVWNKNNTGTGAVPVVTAGFIGPDGVLPAWRVQLDYGAGTGLSNISETLTGLGSPHDQALSFWYKSNTGSSHIFSVVYLDGTYTITRLLTATNKWKQFWVTNNVTASTCQLKIQTQTADGSTQVVDILVSAPQVDYVSYIGPFISTAGAEVTRSLPYVDGVSTPKLYDNYSFLDYDSDSLAFLVYESDPVSVGIGNLLRFSRRFARIPANQVTPSSKYIDRPSVHASRSGSNYGVSFVDKLDWIFTSRISVSRVASAGASTITASLPSSNVTFIAGGITVNVAANASKATIESALAALTSLSGVTAYLNTVTGITSVSWIGTMTSVTVPSGVKVNWISLTTGVSFSANGTSTTPAVTTITATSHGAIVGDYAALWAGNGYVGKGVVVSIIDADNFTMMTSDLSSADSQITHCAFSSDAAYCVVNGPKMCSLRLTQRYYLPGYTTGITTAADITPPATATDPISWLAAIVAGTAWVVDSVTDLKSWDGPILVQESSEIQMADAIDTVTP